MVHVRAGLFLMLLSTLFFGGCTTWESISKLEDDLINNEAGFDSILILDIEIEDSSSLLASYGNPTIWEFYKGETQSDNRMSDYIFSGEWDRVGTVDRLRKTIELETISGTHQITTISFTHQDTIYSYKIFQQFEIPAHSIAYLGTIQLKIDETGTYRSSIISDKEARQRAVADFQSDFPTIYEQYQGNIVPVVSMPFSG